jgi:hypothetical protein
MSGEAPGPSTAIPAPSGQSTEVKAVKERKLKIKTPEKDARLSIDADAQYPDADVELELQGFDDGKPEYSWTLTIKYVAKNNKGTSKDIGSESFRGKSTTSKWKLFEKEGGGALEKVVGGEATLHVETKVGDVAYKDDVVFQVLGTNPGGKAIQDFLIQLIKTDYAIDDAIIGKIFATTIYHESYPKWSQFNSSGLPIVSPDFGFGVAQLTSPAPTQEEVWNWKTHLRKAVSTYLQPATESGKTLLSAHTPFKYKNLAKEVWCRYNSGQVYHKWKEDTKEWVCTQDALVCHTSSNVGWLTTASATIGKETVSNKDEKGTPLSVSDLYTRDKSEIDAYGGPKKNARLWGFYGWCYADYCLNHEYTTATGETFPDTDYPNDKPKSDPK